MLDLPTTPRSKKAQRGSFLQAVLATDSVVQESVSSDDVTGPESNERGSTTDEDLQKSEYEQFDDVAFDFGSDRLDSGSGFSKARVMQRAVAGLQSFNSQRRDLSERLGGGAVEVERAARVRAALLEKQLER